MSLRIRSWGKWQGAILYTIGKSRIANKVAANSPYSMASVVIASSHDDDLLDFQEKLGDRFADAYWIRLLRHVALHDPLTGIAKVSRATMGRVALSTPWHAVSRAAGAKVYDALIASNLVQEVDTSERVAPTICAKHKRYLCPREDGTCSEFVPNRNGTPTDPLVLGLDPALADAREGPPPRRPSPDPIDWHVVEIEGKLANVSGFDPGHTRVLATRLRQHLNAYQGRQDAEAVNETRLAGHVENLEAKLRNGEWATLPASSLVGVLRRADRVCPKLIAGYQPRWATTPEEFRCG